jgi:hypothetical protein
VLQNAFLFSSGGLLWAPFLNLDDEDTPAFQTASKNSQFLAKRSMFALLLAR